QLHFSNMDQPYTPPQPVAPTSGGGGSGAAGAANVVGGVAIAGASAAQRGVINLSIYVQHNPAIVKVFCCLAGIALSVISILPIVGIGNSDKEGEEWTTRDTLQCVYTFLFGFLIIMIDMKEDWVNKVFGLQTKLFLYCNFLATQTGRAGFYFYVGSITICLLPKSQLWSACYIVVGGCLCLLGLIMMGLRWCPWCQPEARASSTQLPAQS
ncbi:unnamed protein product, partial [Polarella glacialis]